MRAALRMLPKVRIIESIVFSMLFSEKSRTFAPLKFILSPRPSENVHMGLQIRES